MSVIFRKTIKLGCVANDCRLSIDMRCRKTLDRVLPQKRFVIHFPKRQLRLIVGMDKEIVVGLMKSLAMPKESQVACGNAAVGASVAFEGLSAAVLNPKIHDALILL